MHKIIAILAIPLLALLLMPAAAQARVVVGVGFGGCCYGGYYGGYYPAYYPSYYPSYYYSPAPVVYSQPAPTVVYVQQPAAAVVPAPQASSTFVDSFGRTCRQSESGMSCRQTDGTWRSVNP